MKTENIKYRTEVAAINEDTWSTNGMEYDTITEARKWLDNLSSKWFGYDMSRIVPVSTPSNQKIDYDNDVFYQNFRKGVEVKHEEKYEEPKKDFIKEHIIIAGIPKYQPKQKYKIGERVLFISIDKGGLQEGHVESVKYFEKPNELTDKMGWAYFIPEFGSIMLSEDSIKPYLPSEIKENIEVKEMKIFKGVDYKYANLYEQNKAIEELIDFRIKYEIVKNGNMNLVSITENTLTSEETVFLNKYAGYGGLAEFGAKGISLFYEYFTPDEIVKMMWGLAYKYGYKDGGRVCEPSVGTARFFKFTEKSFSNTGYEINLYSALISKILYPESYIYNNYFEEVFIKNNLSIKNKISDLPKYDLVIGNPPYGDIKKGASKWFAMGEDKYSKATNYIDYFIFRGLDLLVGGGLLIYIVGAEKHAGGSLFLEKGNNKTKEMIAEKAELIDAYKLPAGLFETTKVSTELIILRKN